jgi:exodeoxyribonuclease V alpha subunit
MNDDPLLATMVSLRCVDSFDLMLGQKIQDGCWLGVYVSRAFRQGHMAVKVGEQVSPSVRGVFSNDGIPMIDEVAGRYIEKRLKEELVLLSGQLVVEGEMVALPYAHAVEVRLAREVERLSTAAPFIQVKNVEVEDGLNEGQKAAVLGAMDAALCLVTGGPGTGKTYTAGLFLKALEKASCVRPLRVAVAAPTGRAVQTLFASMAKVIGGKVSLEARTIHSLTSKSQGTFLPYHIVIVDESSMIGSDLMLKLLQSLASGTRVMMLGDADQLPSVDPGQPFFELLKAAQGGVIRHFSLQRCHRTTSKELLEIAACICHGDCRGFEERLVGKSDDVTFVECGERNDWKRAESIVEREVIAPWCGELSMENAVGLLRKTTLLTSCRGGYWGTDSVNSRAGRQKIFTPVVSTKNSHHLGVMNGDLGVLERHPTCDQVHFPHCTVPSVLLPRVERAFAMTVHKSQGGEFDTVAVVVPPGALVDRRLLYTAITRAKRRLLIIGQKGDVVGAVGRREERMSTLATRIQLNPRSPQSSL